MITFFFIVVILVGCNSQISINSNGIKSIKLECIGVCLDSKDEPFAIKEFDDQKSIKLFSSALNQANKLKGILDYQAIFLMKIEMKDGRTNQYHFSISNTTKSQKGLILKLPDTSHGYSIPEKISIKLKELIYDT